MCGVGKSGIIAIKNIINNYHQLEHHLFHYLQMIVHMVIWEELSKKDILILISYSGKSNELKNIINLQIEIKLN